MRINSTLNGGVRSYVSILPALFPAIVLLTFTFRPNPVSLRSGRVEISPVAERVRQIYTSQIGVREKQPNSGPEVEKYLRYVNLPKGNPWCAAFVCWVFGEAGVGNPRSGWSPDLFGEGRVIWGRGESRTKSQEPRFPPSVPSAYAPSPVTGNRQRATEKEPRTKSQEPRFPPGVPNWEQRAKSKEQTCLPASQGLPTYVLKAYPSSLATDNRQRVTPRTADIFGLYFPEKGRIAHVGFVDQWDGTWMTSVEGNTNSNGSREGDGVYRKKRLVRTIYKVARYLE